MGECNRAGTLPAVESKSHRSLSVNTNIVLVLIWLLVLALSIKFLDPFPVPIVVGMLLCGAIAGWLQRVAIRRNIEQFRNSHSLMEVRRAMTVSREGRPALWLMWITVLLMVALVLTHRAEPNVLICGYAAFALAREVIALPELTRLKRLTPQN